MSNLEKDPAEVLVAEPSAASPRTVEVLEPREVPLGGPRAMSVHRTLPQRARSLVGAWCFADHYGEEGAPADGPDHGNTAMNVPPHPHTGLQTVSWLFAGTIEHRDSVGSHALIEPGQVNLMTAGAGIQHSEVSAPGSAKPHGVQLWVALPDAHRGVAPFFEHFVPEPIPVGEATLRVFVGSLHGSSSAVTAFTPLLGAQLDLPAGTSVELPVDPAFEHGLLVDAGEARLDGIAVPLRHLGFVPVGADILLIAAGDEPLRAILLGGAPFGEQIVMWWNFVGRSHEEVVAFREQWQGDVIGGGNAGGRFGHIDGWPGGSALPAPELPNVRLRPRD